MDIEAMRRRALSECRKQIKYFRTHGDRAFVFIRPSQIVVVVLSAVVPVLLLAEPSQVMFLVPDSALPTQPSTGAGPAETAAYDSGRLAAIEAYRRLTAALLSAIVAIVTGLNAAFKWQEQWVRSAFARESLTSESIKFQTRAEDVYAGDLQDAIAAFVLRTEAIRLAEATEWKTYELSTVKQLSELEQRILARLDESRASGGAKTEAQPST